MVPWYSNFSCLERGQFGVKFRNGEGASRRRDTGMDRHIQRYGRILRAKRRADRHRRLRSIHILEKQVFNTSSSFTSVPPADQSAQSANPCKFLVHPASYRVNEQANEADLLLKCCARIESLLNVARVASLISGRNPMHVGMQNKVGKNLDRLDLTTKWRVGKEAILIIKNLRVFDRMIDRLGRKRSQRSKIVKTAVAEKREQARALWQEMMTDMGVH